MTGNAVVTLKKGEGRTLKAGGMWIYDNEIDNVTGNFAEGDIISVRDFDGYFLGYGFINTHSKITVRILSRRENYPITEEFIVQRVQNAWNYRKETVDISCCRIIFGEADFLPGIVIDKFSDILVVESLALGIDRLKPLILRSLTEILKMTVLSYAVSMKEVMPKSGSRRAWNVIKGFLQNLLTPAWKL